MEKDASAIQPALKREILLLACVLGLLGDLLLRQGVIGPGLTLWVGLAGLAATGLALRGRHVAWAPVAAWSAVAFLAALMTVFRASEPMQALLFLLLPLTLSQIVMLSWSAGVGRSLPMDHLYGGVLVPVRAVLGAVPMLGSLRPRHGRVWPRLAGVGRGLVLAFPLLWIFTGLLSSADAAFGRAADRTFALLNSSTLASHLLIALALAWVTAGWLVPVVERGNDNLFRRLPLPRLGRDETWMVFGLLTLLFGLFVVLQLGYLFGGRDVIESVSGLTVADYARRGFFELVVTGVLTVALLVVGNAVTSSPRLFRGLAAIMITCVLVMLVSAVHRFVLYIEAFGLSLDRLTVLAILLWLAFTLLFLAATVLRGRPIWFASGVSLAGIVTVLGLALLNPAAVVARVNLDRAVAHQQELDIDYLLTLGADAVPMIVERISQLSRPDQCLLATDLLDQWAAPADDLEDWRVWNWSQARAGALVSDRQGQLRRISDGCIAL